MSRTDQLGSQVHDVLTADEEKALGVCYLGSTAEFAGD
jgi:hypothetical protein